MKAVLFSIIISLVVLPLFLIAQQDISLPGVVVEQNSRINTGKVNFLSRVSIKAPKAGPTTSDARGKFTLVFSDQPLGGKAKVFASKSGYVVVNEKELNAASVIGRIAALKVVMCKPQELYDNQVAYYEIAEGSIRKLYEHKISLLEQESEESKQLMRRLEEEMNREINSKEEAVAALEEQRFKLEQQLQELVDKFVTVNLDDQSETYVRAYQAFMAGELEQTLAILDSVDLEARLKANQKTKIKVDSAIAGFEKDKAVIEKQMQQDLEQLLLKARTQWLTLQFDGALESYKLALKYDASNVPLRWEYADRLFALNRFEKSMAQYDLASRNSQDKRVRTILKLNAGIVGKGGGGVNLKRAERELTAALQAQREQANNNLEADLPALAKTLNASGVLHMKLNKLGQAENYLNEAVVILEILSKSQPEAYAVELANALNNLGAVQEKKGKNFLARGNYENALEIYEEVSETYDKDLMVEIAGLYNNLGVLSLKEDNFVEKDHPLFKSLDLYNKLAAKNPQAHNVKLATVHINIAGLYTKKLIEEYKEVYKKKGLQFLEDADSALAGYPQTLPIVAAHKKKIQSGRDFFTSATEESMPAVRQEMEEVRNMLSEDSRYTRKNPDPAPVRTPPSGDPIALDPDIHISNAVVEMNPAGEVAPYDFEKENPVKNPLYGHWHKDRSELSLNEPFFNTSIEKADTNLNLEQQLEYYLAMERGFQSEKPLTQDYFLQCYNGLSRNYLLLGKFKEAEAVCLKAKKIRDRPSTDWIPVNLALAYLYQGKWSKAKSIFTDLRYRVESPFIPALEKMEAAGHIHPDVARAKEVLNR